MRLGIAILALAACGVLAVSSASAAKSQSSISLVVMTSAAAGTTSASPLFADTVTFNVSTSASAYPWVVLRCYQNRSLVYEMRNGFFGSYTGAQTFQLGPTQLWQGGAADCTAKLVDDASWKTLASTSFHVSG